ncbi:hypothetical protein HC928_16000 [bacterium]|nr:hypothetical protein [bacterium]
MNLEKRIEVLEQELTLLKNQIQATLLEIQEAVLAQKHAELRGDTQPAEPDGPEDYPPMPRRSMPTDTYHNHTEHEATIGNPGNLRRVSLRDDDQPQANPPLDQNNLEASATWIGRR